MKTRRDKAVSADFFKGDVFAGIALFAAAILAMIMANSALRPFYSDLAHIVHVPINDGLMVVFFFLIGLEIRHEATEGELATGRQARLPVIMALGGMIVPALIFYSINTDTPQNLNGWAIASATDIAFALAVVSLLGKRIPKSIRTLLLAIAVLDDLGAILIIAFFYNTAMMTDALALAAASVLALVLLRRKNIAHPAPYLVLSVILWWGILQSGIHATIAGVIAALCVPKDLAQKCEHALKPWVALGIMPLFAFFNAGVPLSGISLDSLTEPLPLGILLGLFIGKQLGIFASAVAAVKMKLASLPAGTRWPQVYGMAILCGIGFTMSLFIGMLAFHTEPELVQVRLGVLAGSLLSLMAGYAFLRLKKNSITLRNR